MAFPATDRLVKAEIRFTWNNQLVENRLHFQHAIDSPDPTNMADLAQELELLVTTDWLPLMASTVAFREVYVEEYAGAVSQSATETGTGVGSAAGESMPGNATFCLSLRTEFVGRARRGRFYTIGMTENHQVGGVASATYRNGWLAAMNNLISATGALSWALVVASFWLDGLERPTGLVTPVTAVVAVDDFVDSQRRRLQGRGH